jgi:WD40 repeat protein
MESARIAVRIDKWLWAARCAAAVLLMQLVAGIACGQAASLRFVKKIGVGWDTEKYGWMSFVAFRPDGKRIAADAATGREDVSGDLTLWSFPEGRLIKKLHGRPMAISNDWKYYATFHGVFEVETGRLVIALEEKDFAGFVFSPDSRYVVESWGADGVHNAHIRVQELTSGKEVRAFGGHEPQSMAISPDGATLAAGYWDAVALWNLATGKRVAVLPGFGRYVRGLAFSPDGGLLAAGSDTGNLQIWDVRRRKRLQSLEIGGGDVSNPAFSPDGRLVAVGIYGTGTVFLIDVRSGKVVDQKLVSGIGCGSGAFSPDGHFLIVPSTGGLVRWPYDRGGTVRVFRVVAAEPP